MYTFGYIREATQAHIDLDEQETQAMHLQERYHIYANEAMQAICGVKPKYDYFACEIVKEYWPVINLGDNKFRKATEIEINWEAEGIEEPNFADPIDTKLWYEKQHIYLLDEPIKLPEDFFAFAEKQAWLIRPLPSFDSELFIKGRRPTQTRPFEKVKATKAQFAYTGRNTLTFYQIGKYLVPYKGVWYRFKSGISDEQEIDMPTDIFLTIPLYVAALCLQVDHAQRALTKRAEFEAAIARCAATDFLDLKDISATFK